MIHHFRRLSLSLLILGLCACGYVPLKAPMSITGGNYEQAALDSQSIRLQVWNIHKEGNLKSLQREFAQLSNTQNPNLILLQEVRLDNTSKALLNEQKRYGWELSANIYQPKLTAYSGVLTAATAAPLDSRALLSESREPILGSAKPKLLSRYPLSNSDLTLLVLNIHAINFQLDTKPLEAQLALFKQRVQEHRGPVIVAGDFNSWSKKRIALIEQAAVDMHLTKIDFGSNAPYLKTMFGHPLDHIFYNHQYLQLKELSVDVFEQLSSSDHRALFAEFTLRKPAQDQ
jgi:endonuclease/exonuclease/phosphatase (EEP) superfamily protein YafD